jgi:hypothetical protein
VGGEASFCARFSLAARWANMAASCKKRASVWAVGTLGSTTTIACANNKDSQIHSLITSSS